MRELSGEVSATEWFSELGMKKPTSGVQKVAYQRPLSSSSTGGMGAEARLQHKWEVRAEGAALQGGQRQVPCCPLAWIQMCLWETLLWVVIPEAYFY